MPTPRRLVVFDALLFRALVVNDRRLFPDEIEAFTVAFRARRFRVVVTEGILREYGIQARNHPPFQVQPLLDELLRGRRALYFEEYQLNRVPLEVLHLPREHRRFVGDALAARASYLVTDWRGWLRASGQTERYGLRIVKPRRFVELEG